MYLDLTLISERLNRDYVTLTTMGYEVLGVFVYGSQNYELSTELSDIDTKAIVIPTVDNMIFGKTTIKTQLDWHDGICDVHDIVSMHESFKKQNINFLEILFTDYRYINPKYYDLYMPLIEKNEDVAHICLYRALMANLGTMSNKLHKLLKSVPSNVMSIEKYGYDNKALCDIFRIKEFIERFTEGVSFKDCLVSTDLDNLYEIKTNPMRHSVEDATSIHLMMTEWVDNYRKRIDTELDSSDYNKETLKLIDQVTLECCKKYIIEELN